MKNLALLLFALITILGTSCSKESHSISPIAETTTAVATTTPAGTGAFNSTTLCGEAVKTPEYQKLTGKWSWKMTTRQTRLSPEAAPLTPATENKTQEIVISGNTIKISENGRPIFSGDFTMRTLSNGSVVLESEEMQGIVKFGAGHNCLTLCNAYRDAYTYYFERQ